MSPGRHAGCGGDIVFEAAVIEWRGRALHYFDAVPAKRFGEVSYAASEANYGWGCAPVAARIAGASFTTSSLLKNDGYLLPLTAAVRVQAGIAPGDGIWGRMRIVRARD